MYSPQSSKIKTNNNVPLLNRSQSSTNFHFIKMPNIQWLSCSQFALYKNQWQVPVSTLETIQWGEKAAGFLFSSQHFIVTCMILHVFISLLLKLLVLSFEKPELESKQIKFRQSSNISNNSFFKNRCFIKNKKIN